jgi:hypothetical protein
MHTLYIYYTAHTCIYSITVVEFVYHHSVRLSDCIHAYDIHIYICMLVRSISDKRLG